jgi:4-amino-4-deoxy-L-arabinose transferase-like glycosyltransferase
MARRSWLTGMFAVLACIQTMAYYVYLRDDAGNYNGAGAQGDQVAYIELAQQLLQGTWQGAVHYMPGLPAVIALGQLLTGDPRLGIALIQGLVYAACVVFAARLAAAAFGERAQTWAAALVGLNPALGYYAAQALTEFLTAAVLLGLAAAAFRWGRQPRLLTIALIGLLIGAAAYLRSEYLGLSLVFAVIVLWMLRRRLVQAVLSAALVIVVTSLTMAPWVVRYTLATGSPALYNESPFSNLVLMGTWFRVFDEQTFSELQQIETAPGTRDQAIERAKSVGPRPELSQRYMEQARGPYERPLPETLGLAADNIRLNLRQYLVNHVVLAPVLIWAGHTPLRQSDAPRLPSTARYSIWVAELALLALALWQALLALREATQRQRNSTSSENSSSSVELENQGRLALALSFLGIVIFLTAVHTLIAVDERFTTPALPVMGLMAGARAAELVGRRQSVAVRYAA